MTNVILVNTETTTEKRIAIKGGMVDAYLSEREFRVFVWSGVLLLVAGIAAAFIESVMPLLAGVFAIIGGGWLVKRTPKQLSRQIDRVMAMACTNNVFAYLHQNEQSRQHAFLRFVAEAKGEIDIYLLEERPLRGKNACRKE